MQVNNNDSLKNDLSTTIHYELRIEDYILAQKQSFYYYLIIYFGLQCVLGLNYWAMLPYIAVEGVSLPIDNLQIYFLGSLTIAILMTLVCHSKYSFIYHWNLNRSWKRSKFTKNPQSIKITKSGITFRLGEKEETRYWLQYKEFKEKESLFLMFYISESSDNYYIVPKRAFKTDEELLKFRNSLKTTGRKFHVFLDLR